MSHALQSFASHNTLNPSPLVAFLRWTLMSGLCISYFRISNTLYYAFIIYSCSIQASHLKMWDFWESQTLASQNADWQCLGNDPDGTEVYLSQVHWNTHILDKHRDMLQKRYLMLRAIMCPVIRRDAGKTNKGNPKKSTYCYSHLSESNPEKIYYLHVVVKYLKVAEMGSRFVGLVSTAHIILKDRVI